MNRSRAIEDEGDSEDIVPDRIDQYREEEDEDREVELGYWIALMPERRLFARPLGRCERLLAVRERRVEQQEGQRDRHDLGDRVVDRARRRVLIASPYPIEDLGPVHRARRRGDQQLEHPRVALQVPR